MKLSLLNKQNGCGVFCFSSLPPMKVPVHKIPFMYVADIQTHSAPVEFLIVTDD